MKHSLSLQYVDFPQAVPAQTLGTLGASPKEDAVLQDILAAVVRDMAAPIAMLNVVVGEQLFVRAQIGLPEHLRQLKEVPVDQTLCQFVVRGRQTVHVEDHDLTPRIDPEVLQQFGVRSYLGEPIWMEGDVVGALCVLDRVPRVYSESQRGRLAQLAAAVGQRFQALTRQARHSGHGLIEAAAAPMFAELRNLLTSLIANAAAARELTGQLGPLPGVMAVEGEAYASQAAHTLHDVTQDLDGSARQLASEVLALETLMLPASGRTHVERVVSTATRLANHELKLHGGIVWDSVAPELSVSLPSVSVSAALSALLVEVSSLARRPLRGRVTQERCYAVFIVSVSLDPQSLEEIEQRLDTLLDGYPAILVERTEEGIRLLVPGS